MLSCCLSIDVRSCCPFCNIQRVSTQAVTLHRNSLRSLTRTNACNLSKGSSQGSGTAPTRQQLSDLSLQGTMPVLASEGPAVIEDRGSLEAPSASSNTRAELESSSNICPSATSRVESSQWPRPLSPIAGEEARKIELERALAAEAAMHSAPAFGREDILYEDEWLLAINKPAGIYSGHILAWVPSMVQTELDQTEASAFQPHLHLANRLDRDTSGVIIITKCRTAAGKITRMFENRKVKKTYTALCIGPRPAWDEIIVESGHGRSRWGAWRVYAKEDVGKELPEKAVVKDMVTQLSIVSVNGVVSRSCDTEQLCERNVAMRDQTYQNVPAFGDELLIRACPFTGRTHQIRLHCQFLGLPLLGDVKYGGPLVWKGIAYNTHALHAESMSFRHPITAVDMIFSAPLPKWAAS